MPRPLSWSAVCCTVAKLDAGHFVSLRRATGKYSVMIVRTSGAAKPVLLRGMWRVVCRIGRGQGDWITYRDEKGWNLILPDGKTSKFLGKRISHLFQGRNAALWNTD